MTTQTKPLKVGDIVYSVPYGRDKLIELTKTTNSQSSHYHGRFIDSPGTIVLFRNPTYFRRINEQ